MAGGGDGDDTGHITFEDLYDRLSRKRNGIALNEKVRSLLSAFAVSTLEVVDEAELLDLGEDGLEAALSEAWDSEKVPNAFVRQLQAWAAPVKDSPPPPRKARTTSGRAKKVGLMEGDFTDGSDGDESVMGDATSEKSARDLAHDMRIYGLCQLAITALDMSLHSGILVPEGDVEGLAYGKESAVTLYSRNLKKLDYVLLPALLSKGDAAGVREHFLGLTRQFNDEGMTKQVTIIHNFLTTTEELFAGDDAGYCAYITAVRRRWKGRAFPKAYDPMTVLKTMKSQNNSAVLKTEVAALKARLTKEEASVVELKAKNASIQTALSRLETRVGQMSSGKGAGTGAGGKGGKGGKTCDKCGSPDHFKKDCPLNEESKDEGATE